MDIEKHIKAIQEQRILVIGDLMLDRFIWGNVNRISPEAPVPVVHVSHESAYPGGAANVARNLAEFGVQATISGVVGKDDAASQLLTLLETSNIKTTAVLQNEIAKTIVKTRIIARHQQVVRVDREEQLLLKNQDSDDLMEKLEPLWDQVDAVILEDYGKGLLTQDLVDQILARARVAEKIIAVDPNPNNPLNWQGATVVKPNRGEAWQAAGFPPTADKPMEFIGQRLLEKWRVDNILMTLGEDGLILFQPPEPPFHTPTRAREVFDVSGAGDTVIAFFTAALAAGLSKPEAALIANHAAGIVVGKLGTATVTPTELRQSFE